MNKSIPGVCLLLAAVMLRAGAAHAESPFERDQREQLEKYQKEHGLSPQVQQTLRWQQEWRQQHPSEPMPNPGELQKLHRQEIINNTNQGFAKMRQARQAKLQHDYLLSKQHQAQILASQHITWTPQQWKEWDRQYDLQQQRIAQDYLKAAAMSGQMAREEAAQEQADRIRNGTN
ncbi:MAG: hypothetical protein WB440_15500 [Steroidobacteraceae bacterium]